MQLTTLSKNLLPVYRDLFKHHWPKYMPSYCVFNHFINRFDKHPEWTEKVKFLTLKDDDISDGVYALTCGPYILIDSLEMSPYPKLEKLIYNLDLADNQMFVNFRDDFRPLIMDLLRMRGMEKTFDRGSKICYFNPNEDYIKSVRKRHVLSLRQI